MPREATLPPRVVNVPGNYFSMAGFEVTIYGRFWVTPEEESRRLKASMGVNKQALRLSSRIRQ